MRHAEWQPASAAAGPGGDHAGGRHVPHAIVEGVGDEQAAVLEEGEGARAAGRESFEGATAAAGAGADDLVTAARDGRVPRGGVSRGAAVGRL